MDVAHNPRYYFSDITAGKSLLVLDFMGFHISGSLSSSLVLLYLISWQYAHIEPWLLEDILVFKIY